MNKKWLKYKTKEVNRIRKLQNDRQYYNDQQ